MLADKSAHTELTVEEKQEAETAFVESMRHWNNQHHNQTNRIPMWSSIRELCYRLKAQPQKAPRDDLILNQLELERAVELADVAEAQILPTCPAAPKAILLLAISDCRKHQRDHEKGNIPGCKNMMDTPIYSLTNANWSTVKRAAIFHKFVGTELGNRSRMSRYNLFSKNICQCLPSVCATELTCRC